MSKQFRDKPMTLTDADISSTRSVTRRSLLGLGMGLGAAAATVVAPGNLVAQQGSGCTDNDRGRNEDQPGFGRRCRAQPKTGCTDNDAGPREDAQGAGKWCWI